MISRCSADALQSHCLNGLQPGLTTTYTVGNSTSRGPVPVDEPETCALIVMLDAGLQPLVRMTRKTVCSAALRDSPLLRPVVSEPVAIGNDRVLRVSLQHRALISSWHAVHGMARPAISAREARVLDTARPRRMSGFQARRFDI